jgi:energy-coupling factor transporter ATP-binding protein EcfA2
MYVRLAFAVAAHLESEILIVDEVLAVGDIEFQTKCLGKMSEVSKTAHKTILFVSHNMSAIKTLCNKGLYMQHGTIKLTGDIAPVIENYLSTFIDQENNPYLLCEGLETEEVNVKSIRLLDDKGNVNTFFLSNSEITIEIEYDIKQLSKNTRIIAALRTNDGTMIFETSDVSVLSTSIRTPGKYTSRLKLPANLFNIGRYFLSIVIDKPNERKLLGPLDISFSITDLMNSQIGIIDGLKPDGIIHPGFEWEVTTS